MSVNEKDILANEITLDQTSLSLVKGQSKKIEVTAIKPENAADKTVTWGSADEKVASVDENGNVTGVAPGTTTITAKVGLASATCNVTVTDSAIPVTSVSLDKKSIELHVGDKGEQLAATISPENATDKTVSWSSSDATVAKVDQNGFVTPVKEGTATITATVNGQSATCKVTVEEKKANEPTKPCTAYNGKSSSLPETGTTAPATRSLVTKAFSTKTETSSSHPTPRAASISSIAPERMVRICTTAMPPTRAESTQSSENPRLTRWRYLRPEPST
ncbi:MAG TPA: Ig domain-containing protein [Candidatus Enterosoma merdigallinarum]|nr:Ig domain-containing protein [Candidatus Enterosoma merdigallinarum]